jgi:sigma-B regulation protein RsbU (phosphoserine phosphatase)
MMPTETTRASRYRPLLLAMAILFSIATVTYSVGWMYYVRAMIQVEVGMDTDPAPAGIKVRDVWRDSPAEHAGLRANDIIIAINGRDVTAPEGSSILNQIWYESHPGETVNLTVRRAGEVQPRIISPVFRALHGTGDTLSLARRGAFAIVRFYPLLFLVVGLPVLFLRIEDRNAWLLALVFAGFITVSPRPVGFAYAPERLQIFLYHYAALVGSVLPSLFYFFFAVFPSRSPIDRKMPWLKWLLLACGICLGWGGVNRGDMLALPFITALLGKSTGLVRLTLAYGTVVLGLISLFWNVVSATSVEDRRKLKVMMWGTLVGLTPAILIGAPYDWTGGDVPFWLDFTRVIFLILVPLSFAYAVVKHRVMDIPVLLRRSARYLLVERGFAILILVVSVGITLWFGQAFAKRFSGGTRAVIPIGATFGVLLFTGATQVHRHVRTRLDRAFFRSAYDAQQILETLASTTLTVTDREALAALLYRQIQEALHPMPLYVYLLSSDGKMHAYAGHPPQDAIDLPGSGPELAQLTGRNEPVEVNPTVLRGTPLESLGAECLVPICGSNDGKLQGLAVLGPRLSEEPYSTRDKRLLASVASQAGIAMRSISLAEKMAERMEAERRAEQEMEIARQVQIRLLPQQAPTLKTLDVAGKVIQTRAVGGDYYDFLEFGAGKLGLVLADIAGKGMSGALLMANLQANLRGQYALAVEDLPRLLRSVNYLFYKNTESNHYATMFFSIYDDQAQTLRYVNCGHNPPILLRAGGSVERLEATATVLGLFEQWDCTVEEKQLAPGDVLVIYTDGISEAAAGDDGEEFGEDRLVATAQAHRDETAEHLLDTIVAEVQSFSQGYQADDMTLIVGRRR